MRHIYVDEKGCEHEVEEFESGEAPRRAGDGAIRVRPLRLTATKERLESLTRGNDVLRTPDRRLTLLRKH